MGHYRHRPSIPYFTLKIARCSILQLLRSALLKHAFLYFPFHDVMNCPVLHNKP